MPRGPLPLRMHAMMEPLAAIVIIASPWIFGYSESSDAKTLAIVVGIIMLVSGMTTRWRWSLAKLVPLRAHFATDVLLGIFLIAAPFIFGFGDEGGAARFFVIAGILELGTALATNWDEREEVAATRDRTHATPTP